MASFVTFVECPKTKRFSALEGFTPETSTRVSARSKHPARPRGRDPDQGDIDPSPPVCFLPLPGFGC